jgi:tetratricopeptide (TPR) repeat protein
MAEQILRDLLDQYPDEKQGLESLAFVLDRKRDHEQAITYLERVVEIDPLYKEAYNGLAYDYSRIGNFEKAIWAADKYVELAPDEHNPYDTRGDIYASHGRLDEAIGSYEQGLKIRPDFGFTVSSLAHMYLFKREYAKAESLYRELCSNDDKDFRSAGRIRLAYLQMYQGKFNLALETLDAGIAADRMDKTETWLSEKYSAKAGIRYERGETALARENEKKGIEEAWRLWPDDAIYWHPEYVRHLARSGDIAGAEEEAEVIRRHFQDRQSWEMYYYWRAVGWIELARGDLDEAAADFERAEEMYPTFWNRFDLAKVYLELGRLGEAVELLEKSLSRYDSQRAGAPIAAVKTHYLLAVAYEESGWKKKAIEQYEEFLEIWKEADPGIEEVEDARERLANLKGAS